MCGSSPAVVTVWARKEVPASCRRHLTSDLSPVRGHAAISTRHRTRLNEQAMVFPRSWPQRGGMKKRVLSAVLWFYCGWYAGAMIAHALGISPALGPILGVAAAALIAGDPRGIIWTRAPSSSFDAEPA